MVRISKTQRRFALVGLANSLIDYGIFISLSLSGLSPFVANLFATTAAFLFSFTANKRYTFAHIEGKAVRQFLLFVGLTLCGLWIIQPIIITVSIEGMRSLGLGTVMVLTVAKLFGIAGSMVWNYLCYTKIVFRSKN